jgi:hypothetical protein
LPADNLLPGLGIHVNQRVTPELMWRGQNLSHANGARGIAGLVAVSDNPAAMAAPYGKFYGVEPKQTGDGGLAVAAGKATLRFVTPALLKALFSGVGFKPKPPFVPALELFVDDPEATAAYMTKAEVPHKLASDGAVEVGPEHASGALLRFVSKRR